MRIAVGDALIAKRIDKAASGKEALSTVELHQKGSTYPS